MKGLNHFETSTIRKGFLKSLFADAMKSVLEKAVDEIVREQSFIEGTAKESCTSLVLYNPNLIWEMNKPKSIIMSDSPMKEIKL